MLQKLRGIFESLIVFAVLTGILLPARLLFVEYVSDNWFGSLGVISAISIAIIVLAKKKKLGFFGSMLERQIYKFQKGKRGLVVFGESIFLLLVLGGMIFAIEQGNSTYSYLKTESAQKLPATNNPEQILKMTDNVNDQDWLMGFLMTPVTFVTEFPKMSAIIASIDQKLDGWLLHFYTVGFVEYLELFGILVFYRLSFRLKAKQMTQNLLYSKTPV